jgi:hypothetical protein
MLTLQAAAIAKSVFYQKAELTWRRAEIKQRPRGRQEVIFAIELDKLECRS